jgi:hypothetical protein
VADPPAHPPNRGWLTTHEHCTPAATTHKPKRPSGHSSPRRLPARKPTVLTNSLPDNPAHAVNTAWHYVSQNRTVRNGPVTPSRHVRRRPTSAARYNATTITRQRTLNSGYAVNRLLKTPHTTIQPGRISRPPCDTPRRRQGQPADPVPRTQRAQAHGGNRATRRLPAQASGPWEGGSQSQPSAQLRWQHGKVEASPAPRAQPATRHRWKRSLPRPV